MEKLIKNRHGQWSLKKEAPRNKPPKIPVVQAKDSEEPKPQSPINGIQKEFDSIPGFKERSAEMMKEPSTEHDPSVWGPRMNIRTDQIIHPSNAFVPSEDLDSKIEEGKLDYDYVRNRDGRVYRQLWVDDPEFNHFHGMFMPTNWHESDSPDDDPSLSDLDDVGVLVKPSVSQLN